MILLHNPSRFVRLIPTSVTLSCFSPSLFNPASPLIQKRFSPTQNRSYIVHSAHAKPFTDKPHMASQRYPGNFFTAFDQWPNPDGDGDEIDDSQVPISQSSEVYLLGFLIANVVGLQYYTGKISGREMVGLVREPFNPYDENAIKVFNTRNDQVGHVERSVAKVLAPLIDQNLISVEGIVPKVAGARNRFRLPVQIHIFTHREAFGRIKSAISRGGFQLISNDDASFTLSEAAVVKEKKAKQDGKSVDEIFKLVDENVSKKMAMKELEPPKDIIKSELFLHQKEGLWWLRQREDLEELPPFWEERDGAYVNVLTNYQTDRRPEPLRGGIFADDMGLGKTLTLLSLIALDKCGSFIPTSIESGVVGTQQNEENDEGDYSIVDSGSKKGKRGRPSKNASSSRKRGKTEDINSHKIIKGKSLGGLVKCGDVPSVKSTLIVCPPSVFSTWVTQLGEHTRPGKLKTYMYYGERTQDVEELQKYDIVLTTYSTLATEDSSPSSPMKKIHWWRIILDEAHIIKNSNSQQSRAVSSLNAKRRWVVTGTPIQNGSMDLFSLMAFLRFEPFSIKSYWNSLVQRPLAQGSEKGLSRLQVLMATISLRRTKDKDLIGLPSKTIETCFVELSAEERELYDCLETEGKNLVRDFISAGSLTSNYTTVLSIILRLRQICADLALCPSDLQSLLPSNKIEDVSNNPELLKKLVALLQDGEDMDCPICLSPPNDVVITCCAHVFCRPCILKTLKQTKPRCPLCRHPLTESDLFSSPPESSENGDSSLGSRTSKSSKVSALIQLLSLSTSENPNRKSIVFSQFRKMLILLEEPLKAAGFKFLRLDGSMNARKRSQVIQEFGTQSPDGPTILLASLKASGAGINLTAASRVYLFEPWWNPAVEEQAMDRVHRIGQTEDVKIVRMIAGNSIEERVLELQERKKQLAREAFGRKGQKSSNAVSAGDLRTLMSL